jgi:Ca2+-binding RTX toxin-like protein
MADVLDLSGDTTGAILGWETEGRSGPDGPYWIYRQQLVLNGISYIGEISPYADSWYSIIIGTQGDDHIDNHIFQLPSVSGYSIDGGAGDDTIGGATLLNGGTGDDHIIFFSAGNGDGGDGNDLLSSSSGADTMDGGAGIDTADYGDAGPP